MATRIRLPEDLKTRNASAAERAGTTAHSCTAEKATLEAQRADFDAEADARYARIVESGKTLPWGDMRRYLEKRLEDKQTPRPVAKKKRL